MTQPPEDGPQQGPRFGTDPYDPSAVGGPMAEPKQFGRLKQLTLLSLAIFVVQGIIGLIPAMTGSMRDQVAEQLEAQGATSGLSEEELQSMIDMGMAGGLAFAIGSLVVGIIVYVIVYFGLVKRQNWARIVGIIFAIIGALFSLINGVTGVGVGVDATATMISSLLLLVGAVVAIFWLVTAFNGQVKAYLAQNVQS